MLELDVSPDFRVCGATLDTDELLTQLAGRNTFVAGTHWAGAERVLRRYFGTHKNDVSDLEWAYAEQIAGTNCTPAERKCGTCPLKYRCRTAATKSAPAANLPRAIDLFAGAGGMSVGLEQAGFETVLAADHDPWFLTTHDYNRPGGSTKYVSGDLAEWRHQDESLGDVALLAGGVPCQPFSKANRQRRLIDPRRDLFRVFLDAADSIRPAVVLIENVSEFRHNHTEVEAHLSRMGYSCAALIIDAANFGVPQHRRRFFFLGYSRDAFQDADVRLARAMEELRSWKNPPPTLWDAIGDLPTLSPSRARNRPWQESDETGYAALCRPLPVSNFGSEFVHRINGGRQAAVIYNHKARYNNDRDIEIFRRLRQGEDARAPQVADLMPYINRSHVFHDKYYRLRSDRPSRVITAHMRYDCNSYIHPHQSRGLTVREAARIQGFPDDYVFVGTFQRLYQQVGNAVPPPVARGIGEVVMDDVRSISAVA